MTTKLPSTDAVTRFLAAWLATRQLIQAANFNRFQRAGLSATQFMTLNLLPDDHSRMTLSELARRMNLGTATVAKTIDSLQERGLLVRTRSEVDRREVLLSVTEAGTSLQNAASAEFHGHMTELFQKMSSDQQDGLVAGLEALLTAAEVGVVSRPAIDASDATTDAGRARPARRSSR